MNGDSVENQGNDHQITTRIVAPTIIDGLYDHDNDRNMNNGNDHRFNDNSHLLDSNNHRLNSDNACNHGNDHQTMAATLKATETERPSKIHITNNLTYFTKFTLSDKHPFVDKDPGILAVQEYTGM